MRLPPVCWIPFLALCLAAGAHAESRLVLPYPPELSDVPAATYDEEGERIGGAGLSILRMENGHIVMSISTGRDGGARTVAQAELEDVEGKGLRPVRELSLTRGSDGELMDLLFVDHVAGVGSCTPNGGISEGGRTVALPEDDRVVNVPLNLLFLPLVRGEVERVEFQFFLCGGGARVMDFHANRAGDPSANGSREILEVTYGPDLGDMVNTVAAAFLPRLSFWFEANDEGTYLAHRMPLFSKGPEVMVVRDGLSPTTLVGPAGGSGVGAFFD